MQVQEIKGPLQMPKHNVPQFIYDVFRMLKGKHLTPRGQRDVRGRFWAKNADLINVRPPGLFWPSTDSQLNACRRLKYVLAVAKKYNCKTVNDLLNYV